MSDERAIFWITVAGLMACGLALGQTAAMAVAAMVGTVLAYLATRPDSESSA
jgi:hypothetical protein